MLRLDLLTFSLMGFGSASARSGSAPSLSTATAFSSVVISRHHCGPRRFAAIVSVAMCSRICPLVSAGSSKCNEPMSPKCI